MLQDLDQVRTMAQAGMTFAGWQVTDLVGEVERLLAENAELREQADAAGHDLAVAAAERDAARADRNDFENRVKKLVRERNEAQARLAEINAILNPAQAARPRHHGGQA